MRSLSHLTFSYSSKSNRTQSAFPEKFSLHLCLCSSWIFYRAFRFLYIHDSNLKSILQNSDSGSGSGVHFSYFTESSCTLHGISHSSIQALSVGYSVCCLILKIIIELNLYIPQRVVNSLSAEVSLSDTQAAPPIVFILTGRFEWYLFNH